MGGCHFEMQGTAWILIHVLIWLKMLSFAVSSFRVGNKITRLPLFRSTLASLAAKRTNVEFIQAEREALYGEKLRLLREKMVGMNISVLVVPTDDPHMSEYTADYYNRREFISGFSGSAGVAVVTLDQAYLFVDGRYHQQADMELTKAWTAMKMGNPGIPTSWLSFLQQPSFRKCTIGIDPFLHSANTVDQLKALFGEKNINLLIENPIDLIWTENRPLKPCSPVRVHPLKYAGKTVTEKLHSIRQEMRQENASVMVISCLDEIMWLFNIRGGDVQCNPVSIAYAIVTDESAILFIDQQKLGSDTKAHLDSFSVSIQPYESILSYLTSNVSTFISSQQRVWLDTATINAAIAQTIPPPYRVEKMSPIVLMKAIKNQAELMGMRHAHLRDGAAMVEFLSWLEDELVHKNNTSLTELDIDEQLTATRASFSGFLEPSFPTIAGVNEHGAVIHYRATRDTCKPITKTDMLLLDSGGQYLDGTTDITRTLHFGQPTPYQKEMYTRVLKGHIAIDRLIFPLGTPGYLLDSHARLSLWSVGKDYGHGTGHGVGAALNVHERPQSISPRVPATSEKGLLPNMVVSNEPGYYETGAFGIRIENLLVVQRAILKDKNTKNGKEFLKFEKLTFVPIDQKCIDPTLLSPDEIEWLNTYHAEVREKILPLLRTERAKAWLQEAAKPLA